MEPLDGTNEVVHPEVKAHIGSLVSALGGVSADDDGRYQLGDDALEVLRDIKRWIRFYDEKTNRMDVARCLFEANLIEGDLLPILTTWPENAMDSKFKARIALSCFEVMVPLTWPMERDREQMTVNHHRHMPILELAHVQYKRAIINFDGARILHTAIRAALPSMAIPIGDRAARDQGIIKLVLFFLRNMAMITPPPNVKYDGDESQISRSATIDAFSYQDVFIFLLTLASNMGEDFRSEDTTVMEIIFHLVKRIDIEKLFMDEKQLHTAKATELSDMMNSESAMLMAHNRKGPTRHNRFGTMIWVKRDGGKMSSLSGQDALADASKRNQKMDSNKKFKPPRRTKKENKDERDMGPPTKLNARARDQLRSFVGDFLDSAFNPLFLHVRKTIDREAPHVMQYHRRQFFYLVAWFLEAERTRRKARKAASQNGNDEVSSFNLVAGVLNQEMFITLNRALHESYEYKDWHELSAVMRCFTQILLTVQEMSECGNEDDEEIAENVLSRLFYEEATHDAIANIIRTYKDQGFDYLDAATELVHHFLRILEAYSKQNVDMQVRSRKRTRRKKQAAAQAAENDESEEENNASGNDEEKAERTAKERKFDFHRFCSRFTPQGVVDTFTTFTKFYQELTEVQLKRAHRYFYRLAFKQDMSVMLFRVDTIHLLHSMIKGPESLDNSCGMFKEWEELVKQVLRKCFKKIEERPELLVEMLFSKMQGIAFFLEYGYEKQTAAVKSQAKPGAELEFKYTEDRDREIAIVVGALLDKNEGDHIVWVKDILTKAENERSSWAAVDDIMPSTEVPSEDQEAQKDPEPKLPPLFSVRPDAPARRTAMFKNSYLRLLMKLCGLQLVGPASEETAESLWIIPSDVSVEYLKDTLHYINQAEFSPPTFDEGVSAENQLKRKTVPRKKAAFDDDNDEEELDDEALFPMGGPTARDATDEAAKPKKKRKRLRRSSQVEEVDDSVLEEKARKRREREREKALKIKSALYVKEGDDDFDSEEDEAFFARERGIASRAAHAAKSATATTKPVAALPKKRKSTMMLDVSDDEDDELTFVQRAAASSPDDMDANAGGSETDDTPLDITSDGEGRKRRKVSSTEEDEAGSDNDDDDGVDVDTEATTKVAEAQNDDDDADADDEPLVMARRPRVRGGFVLDSDDDE